MCGVNEGIKVRTNVRQAERTEEGEEEEEFVPTPRPKLETRIATPIRRVAMVNMKHQRETRASESERISPYLVQCPQDVLIANPTRGHQGRQLHQMDQFCPKRAHPTGIALELSSPSRTNKFSPNPLPLIAGKPPTSSMCSPQPQKHPCRGPARAPPNPDRITALTDIRRGRRS